MGGVGVLSDVVAWKGDWEEVSGAEESEEVGKRLVKRILEGEGGGGRICDDI